MNKIKQIVFNQEYNKKNVCHLEELVIPHYRFECLTDRLS